MGDLNSAINSAFDEAIGSPEPASTSSGADTQEPEAEVSEARETTSEPDKPEPAAPAEANGDEEPTGDVLLDKLTPAQIENLKKSPEGRAIYRGLMQSYTQKMQRFSEQERLWDALNNPQTQRQAVEALARSVGLEFRPSDQPVKDAATEVASSLDGEWTSVVGNEAAPILRPLIEKTALQAIQSVLGPLQRAAEQQNMDARGRQAEAQVSQFRSLAQSKGWELSPQIEAKMAELGQQILPAQSIQSVEDGVKHLDRLYRLATADGQEAAIEKRILERMNKAAQTAEPGRGVPSTGREKRSNITKDMSLNEAMDVAFQELGLNR